MPGAVAPMFHGTWFALRTDTELPVLALAPGPALRDTIPAPRLPDGYAVWGAEIDDEWVDPHSVRIRVDTLAPWLLDEARAGRYWHLECGGPWIRVRPAGRGPVTRHRYMDPDAVPDFFDEGGAGGAGRPPRGARNGKMWTRAPLPLLLPQRDDRIHPRRPSRRNPTRHRRDEEK